IGGTDQALGPAGRQTPVEPVTKKGQLRRRPPLPRQAQVACQCKAPPRFRSATSAPVQSRRCRPCGRLDCPLGPYRFPRGFVLLSALFDSLFPLSGRRVPPLTCILSFVRLLPIRQPDNTMASTGPRG